MVEKERRRKLALHLRHFAAGLTTNDEFEDRVTDDVSFNWLPEQYYRSKKAQSDDPAIRPMLELGWCMYSDLERHKLTGSRKPTDEERKRIACWILFLHSDLEYEWPCMDMVNPFLRRPFIEDLLNIFTLGLYYLLFQKTKCEAEAEQELEAFKSAGDYDYWPFISKVQYEEELKNQPFLTG